VKDLAPGARTRITFVTAGLPRTAYSLPFLVKIHQQSL
jgi:hypothetical protein